MFIYPLLVSERMAALSGTTPGFIEKLGITVLFGSPRFLDDHRIELDGRVDVAFLAMPHKSSAEIVPSLLEQGIRVIDASADFRLKDPDEYPKWYDFTHPSPDLLKQAVFGLPELHRDEIASASLVANPGCYSTGAILALAPAVKRGSICPDIVVDSKSGVSGAGRA
jgi:N-acetyl-gamma-glutamyl-phosphate reductase